MARKAVCSKSMFFAKPGINGLVVCSMLYLAELAIHNSQILYIGL